MLDDAEIQRVLVINAHPDDVDFSAAGTIALWTDAGIEVTYCIVTGGDAGGHDESIPRAEIAPLRRAEQTAAAKQVGVQQRTCVEGCIFQSFPDTNFAVTRARVPLDAPDWRCW